MRVQRFFIKESVSQDSVRVSESEVIHQMRDVFRLKKGDKVILLDNSGFEYHTAVELLTREEGVFKVVDRVQNSFIPKMKINLAAALTKKTFEWVLEKGTELGVVEFTPLISERTEKKSFNTERGLRIIQESAEQSGKSILPILNPEVSLKDFISNSTDVFVLDLDGEEFSQEKISQKFGAEMVSILIGPEGGWSEAEIKLFEGAGIPTYSLGKQILRAETAAIAIVSLLLLGK